MILSIENDLLIGFPISDFINWLRWKIKCAIGLAGGDNPQHPH